MTGITKVIDAVVLGNAWQKITLTKDSCYLIAHINKNLADSQLLIIDWETIKSIHLEIGIDSGVEKEPVSIQHINLDFSNTTSRLKNQDEKHLFSFVRLTGLPSTVYIKFISASTFSEKGEYAEITNGTLPVEVNLNTL